MEWETGYVDFFLKKASTCRNTSVFECVMINLGYLIRKCINVDGFPTWDRPNPELCVSQAIKNIFKEVFLFHCLILNIDML